MDDTLSRILLSGPAMQRWTDRAQDLARVAAKHGVRAAKDIPDELARVESDGSLTIYGPMPDGAELSMRVEPDEWAWAAPGLRNQ